MSATFFSGNDFKVIFVHILLLIIKISLTVQKKIFFFLFSTSGPSSLLGTKNILFHAFPISANAHKSLKFMKF